MNFARFIPVLLIPLVVACVPGELEVDDEASTGTSLPRTKGAAAPLTNDSYNALPPLEQYQIANKLMGAFYKGVPASEFFDLSAGTERLRVTGGKDFLARQSLALNTKLQNKANYASLINERYSFDDTRRSTAEPLAAIYEFPVSRDMFESWMAYVLANTILFSPAEEIDSADYVDVQRIYSGLVSAMSDDIGIRQIVLTHMKSQANWRRFRSPEDNTREMIEIYLGLFDRDEDVPKASIACKNWYLTGDDQGYQLVIDELNENTEPQKVLGEWILTCDDFYQLIANHPLVVPRVTTVLVDHFFPNYAAEKRAAIVQDISNTNPSRFHDIFLAIIFSKEYLVYNEKPKNLEETFFNTANRVYWKPNDRFFRDLTNPDPGFNFPTLHKMQQPTMSLKLGRWKDQPLDSLSFAYFHEAIRGKLLTDRLTDEFNTREAGWRAEFILKADLLPQNEYIDYMFISVIGRKPTPDELSTLLQIITDNEYEKNRVGQAMIVLDYLSRLPELYFLNAQG